MTLAFPYDLQNIKVVPIKPSERSAHHFPLVRVKTYNSGQPGSITVRLSVNRNLLEKAFPQEMAKGEPTYFLLNRGAGANANWFALTPTSGQHGWRVSVKKELVITVTSVVKPGTNATFEHTIISPCENFPRGALFIDIPTEYHRNGNGIGERTSRG